MALKGTDPLNAHVNVHKVTDSWLKMHDGVSHPAEPETELSLHSELISLQLASYYLV